MEMIKNLDFVQIEKIKEEGLYDSEFVDKVNNGEKEFEQGQFTTVEKKDLKNLLNL
jgi:hypothetical protein